jgi:hypothetical protein
LDLLPCTGQHTSPAVFPLRTRSWRDTATTKRTSLGRWTRARPRSAALLRHLHKYDWTWEPFIHATFATRNLEIADEIWIINLLDGAYVLDIRRILKEPVAKPLRCGLSLTLLPNCRRRQIVRRTYSDPIRKCLIQVLQFASTKANPSSVYVCFMTTNPPFFLMVTFRPGFVKWQVASRYS